MSNIDDLYDALEKAHAAGRKDHAQEFADGIRELQEDAARTAAPVETFSAVPESMGGRLAAGVGSGLADAWLGARQVAATVTGRDRWSDQLNAEAAEKRRIDAPLTATGAGKVGSVAGSIGALAPLMLIPGAGTVAGGALMGAAGGAVQPTTGDESRAANIGLGGGLGGAASKLGAVLSRSATPRAMNPTQRALQAGEAMGFQSTLGQRTGNRALQRVEASIASQPGFAAAGNARQVNNQTLLNRQAAEAIGEQADYVDSTVLRAARDRIRGVYNTVADDVVRPVDPAATARALNQINDDYGNTMLDPNRLVTDHPLVRRFGDLVARGELTGRAAQNISSRLNKGAKSQMQADPQLGLALREIKDLVDDALGMTLDEPTAVAFASARGQYRTLMQLEAPGVLNPSTGDVSGKSLANALTRMDKATMRYGGKESGLHTAARFHQVLPNVPDSGTATRQAISGPLNAAWQAVGYLASKGLTSAPVKAVGRGIGAAVSPGPTSRGLGRALRRVGPLAGGEGADALTAAAAIPPELHADPALAFQSPERLGAMLDPANRQTVLTGLHRARQMYGPRVPGALAPLRTDLDYQEQ